MRCLLKNDKNLIIHFPVMIDHLLPPSIRPLALFLNPGPNEKDENCYTPQNLVLDSAGARSFIAQSLEFGEQFKKPTDMAYLGAAQTKDFYSDTSMAIRWQITTYGGKNNARSDKEDYLKAQQLLILEYVYEEKLAELDSLNAGLGTAWQELDASLGIEVDDEKFMDLERESLSLMSTSANWKKLLWAFVLLAPEQARLLVHEGQIADELEEAGVVWRASDPAFYPDHFPQEIKIFQGTLKQGRRSSYLGRINQDVEFLKANVMQAKS